MNIKQAKTEIANTLRAYLAKDAQGNYLIPTIRQRPVLLMGPPGVGKTQIMEQVAAEMRVGLVAYSITHHTRQSAVGLPFIENRTYDGETHAVTLYTMSEILASVYELMEKTGLRQGMLFLDEINCVSETLAPMMLQFLQCKTFGNQALPEGWIIVAAGNPPEYNKSVRDFDVVTLDRVKRIDVEQDYGVWKEYALRKGLHGAVLSYLDIKKNNFYRVETTVDGLSFATARGWEDLSELLIAYETLGIEAGREVIEQYIQFPSIAKDFANYLALYYKYARTYHVEDILKGAWEPFTVTELRAAPFDEKLSVMGLVYARLAEEARAARKQDALTAQLHASLTAVRNAIEGGAEPLSALREQLLLRQQATRQAKEAHWQDKESKGLSAAELQTLEGYLHALEKEAPADSDAMDMLRVLFSKQVEERSALSEQAGACLDHAFAFLEETFGDSQEMVIFVTEITAGYDTSWFVENFGCDAYFRHNRELLFDDTSRRIREEISQARRTAL
ncbi:MAG: AAA family ATPase [Clostridia bacterium]|nr:AAA family ATPase [Clostridia bacterium]